MNYDKNNCGLKDLKNAYFELGGNIKKLKEDYKNLFKEPLG